MQKYIDANNFKEFLQTQGGEFTVGHIRKLSEYLRITPAAEVEEVRHGLWRKVKLNDIEGNPTVYECDQCEKRKGWRTPYCPNCGAIMDLEEEENEKEQK